MPGVTATGQLNSIAPHRHPHPHPVTHFRWASIDEGEFRAQVGRIAAQQPRSTGERLRVQRGKVEAMSVSVRLLSSRDAQDAAAMSFSEQSTEQT